MKRDTSVDTTNEHKRRAIRATLSDVAARAGVSTSTASMVLNQHPQAGNYSAQTRQRVTEAARELGYRPNLFARQLRRPETRWLMLCISSFRETFAAEVAHAFEARAAERGYTLIVLALDKKPTTNGIHAGILSHHGVQAIAVVGESTSRLLAAATIAELADEGTCCVLINRDLEHPGVCRVLVDHDLGQREIAEHLYGQGVEKVLILAGPEDWPLGIQRRQVLEKVARERGRPAPRIVHTRATRWNEGYAAMRKLLPDDRPDAVVATTDHLAYGVLRACAEAELKVGRDIAVVGFDDIFPSQFTIPPLTTVRLPMDEMGRIGADLLIDALEAPDQPGRKVILPTRMVERESGRISR
jgi:LacI family transcriptional regulator